MQVSVNQRQLIRLADFADEQLDAYPNDRGYVLLYEQTNNAIAGMTTSQGRKISPGSYVRLIIPDYVWYEAQMSGVV